MQPAYPWRASPRYRCAPIVTNRRRSVAVCNGELRVEPVEIVVDIHVFGAYQGSQLGLDAGHVRLLDGTRLTGPLGIDGDVVLTVALFGWQVRQGRPPGVDDVLAHHVGCRAEDLVIELFGADLLEGIHDLLQHRIGCFGSFEGRNHRRVAWL